MQIGNRQVDRLTVSVHHWLNPASAPLHEREREREREKFIHQVNKWQVTTSIINNIKWHTAREAQCLSMLAANDMGSCFIVYRGWQLVCRPLCIVCYAGSVCTVHVSIAGSQWLCQLCQVQSWWQLASISRRGPAYQGSLSNIWALFICIML